MTAPRAEPAFQPYPIAVHHHGGSARAKGHGFFDWQDHVADQSRPGDTFRPGQNPSRVGSQPFPIEGSSGNYPNVFTYVSIKEWNPQRPGGFTP